MDTLGFDRRRLGTGLLIFGIVGVLLAATVGGALATGALAIRELDQRLAEDQARIAAALTRISVTMESLAITADHAGTSLDEAGTALGDARDLLGDVADTTVAVAGSIDIEILGNRPFASASDRLQALARTVTTFQGDAERLALALAANSQDAAAMTEQVRGFKGQVTELASRVAGFDRIDQVVGLLVGGIVVGGLLTTWVGLGAAFCAWVGLRLRRTPAA